MQNTDLYFQKTENFSCTQLTSNVVITFEDEDASFIRVTHPSTDWVWHGKLKSCRAFFYNELQFLIR